MTAPIIVSALFGKADFAWLDGERRAHFPPDRNVLPAHLTLFHHLPPSIAPELVTRLRNACLEPPPEARIAGVLFLGRGVAYRVVSPGLDAARSALADAFGMLLTPQDAAPWRAHVTIQNKAPADVARTLRDHLESGFRPRPLAIAGLAAWHYLGGPWAPIAAFAFGGARPIKTPPMPG